MLIIAICSHLGGAPKDWIHELASFTFDIFRVLKIHVNVWQKPLQYCKVISLQLIKINEKKYLKVYLLDLYCFVVFSVYTFVDLICCAVLSHQSCPTLCNPMNCSLPGFSVHGDSPGKNTGVGCHALLQGIFPTQGLNSGVPNCRWILYFLSHQGSPRILKLGSLSLLQRIFPA